MAQGTLKKLSKKQQKQSVTKRQSKTTKKGQRVAGSSQSWVKVKKKLQGCYTQGLENAISSKMSASQRDKFKIVKVDPVKEKMTKEERRAKARMMRRNKKKGVAAAAQADAEAASIAKSLAV
eukprot:Sspe_Gene.53853::Locus_29743_Transcript_1_1_Confidence_1.000_Length_484::g.53853::m.53853